MNYIFKHRIKIVAAIGILFIALGLGQAIFHFEVDKKIMDNVTFVLFLHAFAILLGGRKNKKQAEEESGGNENEVKIEESKEEKGE